MTTIRTGNGPWWHPALDASAAGQAPVDRARVARAPGEADAVTGPDGRGRGAEEQGAAPERRRDRPAYATGGAPDPSGNAGRRLDLFA